MVAMLYLHNGDVERETAAQSKQRREGGRYVTFQIRQSRVVDSGSALRRELHQQQYIPSHKAAAQEQREVKRTHKLDVELLLRCHWHDATGVDEHGGGGITVLAA
jgi:hypothetical protein